MNKLILFSALILTSTQFARAADLTCIDHSVKAPTLSAIFKGIGTGQVSVDLMVPNPSGSTDTYSADCREKTASEEPAYECSVDTVENSGYEVRLESNGSASDWSAWALDWDEHGVGLDAPIPCDKLP